VPVGVLAGTVAGRPPGGQHLEDAMGPGHGGILPGAGKAGDTEVVGAHPHSRMRIY
jgi:hypothetical protein